METRRRSPLMWLLLLPFLGLLWVPFYNQHDPMLFGFPFFYWYQLLWVFLAAAICATSFWLLRRERLAHERRPGTGRGETGGRR